MANAKDQDASKQQSPPEYRPRDIPEPKTVVLAKATWVDNPRKLVIDPGPSRVVTEGGDDDPRTYA